MSRQRLLSRFEQDANEAVGRPPMLPSIVKNAGGSRARPWRAEARHGSAEMACRAGQKIAFQGSVLARGAQPAAFGN